MARTLPFPSPKRALSTSTSTVREVRPTRTTRATTSRRSPVRMGTLNSTLPTATVTTGRLARRAAA